MVSVTTVKGFWRNFRPGSRERCHLPDVTTADLLQNHCRRSRPGHATLSVKFLSWPGYGRSGAHAAVEWDRQY